MGTIHRVLAPIKMFSWYVGIAALFASAVAVADPVVNSGTFTELGQPDGCYAIRRSERSGFEKYYSGELVTDPAELLPIIYPNDGVKTPKETAYGDLVSNHKADILCIGDVISILAPMYSNGGDVFILANRLDIRAPIDTRIYFDIGNRARYYRNDKMLPESYEAFFKSYHRSNSESVVIGETTFAPEFPSGASIKTSERSFSPEGQNGSPPPVIAEADRLLATSGSITIFAKSIDVVDSLKAGVVPQTDICPIATSAKPFAFQAGGLRGGKGGMGSPPGCYPVNHSGGVSCAGESYVNSGFSAPPGPGGDASSITILRLGTPFTIAEKASLEKASNVAGGPPGPSAVYKTIDAREVDAGVSTNICDRQPIGQHPKPMAGKAGTVRFGTASVLQALERADSFATGSDARPSVDVKDLIERARTNRVVEHRSMGEFLRSRLARTALSAEKMWAEQLANQVAGEKVTTHPTIEPFGSLAIDLSKTLSPALSNNVSGLARRLAQLDIPPSGNLAASYFSNKGGAFSVTNPDATSTINGTIIGEDLASIIEITETQLQSLKKIELAVSETLYTTRRATVLQKIALVQQRISEIEAIPKKTGATFGEIVASIQQAAPAIAAFVGAVVAENYIAAGKAYPAAMAGINAVYSTAYGEVSDGGLRPGIAELRSALKGFAEDLKSLNETYSQEKSDLLETQFYLANQELAARHRLSTRIDGRLPVGEDLIKHSFVAYFLEPSRNKAYLIENLRESALFLSGRVEYYSMLKLPPISNECQLDPKGTKNYSACLMLPASSSYRVAETTLSGFRVPVWIVAPNSTNTVWPTFNAPIRVTKRKTRNEVVHFAATADRKMAR